MATSNNQLSYWWKEPEKDAWESQHAYCAALEDANIQIHLENVENARVYGNLDINAFDWNVSPDSYQDVYVHENVIQSALDTARANIAKNLPRLVLQTSRGSYKMQKQAKKKERWLYAAMKQAGTYEEAQMAFGDAMIFGTGIMHVYKDQGKVKTERVFPDEIEVDTQETLVSKPRQIHRRKFVDKEVLKAMFPDQAEVIEELQFAQAKYRSGYYKEDHRLLVRESYKLPSGPQSKDGVHSISVEGVTLLWEQYDKDYFPYVFIRWTQLPIGFWGQGAVKQARPIQKRINKLNRFIDICQDLIAVPRVFVDVASKTLKIQINNQIGAIIPYSGKPPVFHTPQAVAAEVYQYKESLKRAIYELMGVSQSSAQGTKPAGVDAAVAMREIQDIETQRFAIQAKNYENMFRDVGVLMLRMAKEIYEETGEYTVIYQDGRFADKIDWSECDIDDDQYQVEVATASLFPKSPPARLQMLVELLNQGVIKKETFVKLVDHPDLESETSLIAAAEEDIDAVIEAMLNGRYMPPEPGQNLQLGIERIQLAWLKYRHYLPELTEDSTDQDKEDHDNLAESLQMMLDWIAQAKDELVRAQPQETAQAPAQMPIEPNLDPAQPQV